MRYILGVLGVLVILIIAIVLLVTRNDGSDSPSQSNQSTKLVDYAGKNSTVSHTTYGKLVGNEQRQAVRIIVTPNERRLEILNSYDETVVSSQTYANTRVAYENFLSAVQNLGFITGRKSNIADPRGVCPTGNRFAYDLSEDGQSVTNLWSNSCDKTGTFAGNPTVVRQLFQAQIPDYKAQTSSIRL